MRLRLSYVEVGNLENGSVGIAALLIIQHAMVCEADADILQAESSDGLSIKASATELNCWLL